MSGVPMESVNQLLAMDQDVGFGEVIVMVAALGLEWGEVLPVGEGG